ncbi:hypothetical protein LINGRAHAP2_LOCUS19550, partial [Linum grandiflorum]
MKETPVQYLRKQKIKSSQDSRIVKPQSNLKRGRSSYLSRQSR